MAASPPRQRPQRDHRPLLERRGVLLAGGTSANYDGVSVNGFLHWCIVEDVLTYPSLDSISRHDFGAVNDERLSRYKSEFNPDLVPYYEIKSDSEIIIPKKLTN